MAIKNTRKIVLLLLPLTLLVGCVSESSDSSSSYPSTSGETSSSTSSVSGISSEASSDISSEASSEVIKYNDFLDDAFDYDYYYNPQSYNIAEIHYETNPYVNIVSDLDKLDFYSNDYQRASSYIDAMYRTEMKLVSGDIRDTHDDANYPLNHLPNRDLRQLHSYRINEGVYEFNEDGSFQSYTINTLHGKTKKIYYGAAYVSLDDIAAYLFAFGRGPANYIANKKQQSLAIREWGEYGRVNDAYYSSDVTEYKYEPMLPHTDNGGIRGENMYNYHELDFGYTMVPSGYGNVLASRPYNNGSSINRGSVRFVYTAETYEGQWGSEYIPVEHRHVFLTYNHYNDFVEYLNYEGGWGANFGWMSAGNEYCGGKSKNQYGLGYNEFIDPFEPSLYPEPTIKSLSETKSILNSL